MSGETQKEMWERRAGRVRVLRQLGYNSGLLSHMTDEEVAGAFLAETNKDSKERRIV